MTDGNAAGQAVDHIALGEGVADQAEPALGMEAVAVIADDAGRLLAAMLQAVQAYGGDAGGVRMAEHAEHAAFEAQGVVIRVAPRSARGIGVSLAHGEVSSTCGVL